MRMARQRKYVVQFMFVCDNGNLIGKANEKEMKHSDLEYALAMVDPFNHEKWMRDIASLRYRGDELKITMESPSDTRGMVYRIIKIVRS